MKKALSILLALALTVSAISMLTFTFASAEGGTIETVDSIDTIDHKAIRFSFAAGSSLKDRMVIGSSFLEHVEFDDNDEIVLTFFVTNGSDRDFMLNFSWCEYNSYRDKLCYGEEGADTAEANRVPKVGDIALKAGETKEFSTTLPKTAVYWHDGVSPKYSGDYKKTFGLNIYVKTYNGKSSAWGENDAFYLTLRDSELAEKFVTYKHGTDDQMKWASGHVYNAIDTSYEDMPATLKSVIDMDQSKKVSIDLTKNGLDYIRTYSNGEVSEYVENGEVLGVQHSNAKFHYGTPSLKDIYTRRIFNEVGTYRVRMLCKYTGELREAKTTDSVQFKFRTDTNKANGSWKFAPVNGWVLDEWTVIEVVITIAQSNLDFLNTETTAQLCLDYPHDDNVDTNDIFVIQHIEISREVGKKFTVTKDFEKGYVYARKNANFTADMVVTEGEESYIPYSYTFYNVGNVARQLTVEYQVNWTGFETRTCDVFAPGEVKTLSGKIAVKQVDGVWYAINANGEIVIDKHAAAGTDNRGSIDKIRVRWQYGTSYPLQAGEGFVVYYNDGDTSLRSVTALDASGEAGTTLGKGSVSAFYDEPKEDIVGANVDISEDLTLNYYVDTNLADVELKVTMGNNTYTLEGEKTSNIRYNNIFTFEGIGPHLMGETFVAELIAGDTVLDKINYSIKNYAINQYDGASDELKNVLRDLILYGAEAQKYAGYKTDTLVSDGIAWAVAGEYVEATGAVRDTANIGDDADNTVMSAGMRFANVNKIYFKIKLTGEYTVLINGEEAELFADEAENVYYVYSEAVKIADYDNVITVAIMDGETVVSEVKYNAKAYIVQKQGGTNSIASLVRALNSFINSAVVYEA